MVHIYVVDLEKTVIYKHLYKITLNKFPYFFIPSFSSISWHTIYSFNFSFLNAFWAIENLTFSESSATYQRCTEHRRIFLTFQGHTNHIYKKASSLNTIECDPPKVIKEGRERLPYGG